ncbi:Caleosin related protein-domain-containing protein [Delphinella strobiligena]|nr:Caleosin related protein-domain-containing protein [Delphinella strobiligena]
MPSATYDRTNGLHVNGEAGNIVQRVKNEVLTVGEALYLGFPDKHGNFMDEEEKQRLGLGANVSHHPLEKPYSICLREVPVTVERRPHYPKEGDALLDPGTARVNIAPSNESPEGTTQDNWAKKHATQTVVQQHTDYFDPDHDGIIWPSDTYRSCRAWGWAIPLCLFATFIINVNLSYATAPSWTPDPFFRIHIKNMHKNKHGSDSMTYDSEGRFRPQNFEDIFAKYDRGHKGGLDLHDLARMLKGQRMAMDLFGWSAALFEWLAVYLLLWPDDGVMRKEDIRRIFDGSIFQHKADEYAEKQRRKKAT